MPELRLASKGAPDRISVRQLLQQTSGLREIAGGSVLRVDREGTTEDVMNELRNEKLVSDPGATFSLFQTPTTSWPA